MKSKEIERDIKLINDIKYKIDLLADKYYKLKEVVNIENKEELIIIIEQLENSYCGLRKVLINLNKIK